MLETAVMAMPYPRCLEVPKALVVLKEGQKLNQQEIIDYYTEKLAKFKVPKVVEFVSELTRNLSGKVLKRELRKQAAPG